MKIKSINFLKKYPLLIIFIVAAFLFFYQIGNNKTLFTDELYLEDAAYGFAKGEWRFIPQINGRIDLSKPPLVYWITSIPYFFINPQNWMKRIFMPIFGLGIVFLTYKLSMTRYDKHTSHLSALFIGTALPIVFFTHTANFDLPNAFFITLTIYFYNLYKKNNKIWPSVSFGILLCLMTRSFFGLFPFLFIFSDSLMFDKGKNIKQLFIIFLTSVMPFLFWLVYASLKEPYYFMNQFIKLPFLYHAISNLHGEVSTSIFYYFSIFVIYPLAILALIKIFILIMKKKEIRSFEFQLGIWIISIFILLSMSQTRHLWYVLPIMSPLSILSASAFFEFYNKNMIFKYLLIPFVFIAITTSFSVDFLGLLPEADIITLVKKSIALNKNSNNLYEWKYPLIPYTRFFPYRNVYIVDNDDEAQKLVKNNFLFLRKTDVGDFSPYNINNIVAESGPYVLLKIK